MQVTILDTQTGIIKTDNNESFDYWAEGNGACDCNRAILFDLQEHLDQKLRLEHPELLQWQSLCFGCTRFLIIQASSGEYSLEELNADYPKELCQHHLPQNSAGNHPPDTA